MGEGSRAQWARTGTARLAEAQGSKRVWVTRSKLVAPQTSLRVPTRALRGLIGVFSQKAGALCLLHLIEAGVL